MLLRKIHLHPFGGTLDRTFALVEGLNVVYAPNEYGKSTVREALLHALLTPTNLTPAKLRDQMGRWYPRPGGDHTAVTVEFESEGHSWLLQKTWGASPASKLTRVGAAPIADAKRVQETLDGLLRHNDATWRYVLFTDQGAFSEIITRLKEPSARDRFGIDDIVATVSRSGAIPQDIPAERLRAAVQAKLDDYLSNWDEVANLPSKGRGIDDKWKKEVGLVLSSYYTKEEANRALRRAQEHEEAIESANAVIRDLGAKYDAADRELHQAKTTQEAMRSRESFEMRLSQLTTASASLQHDLDRWNASDRCIAEIPPRLREMHEGSVRLEAELQLAEQRRQGEETRARLRRIQQHEQDLSALRDRIETFPPDIGSLVDQVRARDQEIRRIDDVIAATRLHVELSGEGGTSLLLTRGADGEERVELEGGKTWQGEADGRVSIEIHGVRVVVSARVGISEMLVRRTDAVESRAKMLQALRSADLNAALDLNRQFSEMERELSVKENLLTAELGDRPLEDWVRQVEGLDALADARPSAEVRQELDALVKRIGSDEQELARAQVDLEALKKVYISYADLETTRRKVSEEIEEARQSLSRLPGVPEGFANAAEFLGMVRTLERELEAIRTSLSDQRERRAKLEGEAPESGVDELLERYERADAAHSRVRSEAEAFRRILGQLNAVIEQRANVDPIVALEGMISSRFARLTAGRYTRVSCNPSGAPSEVQGESSLPADYLSHGARCSMALAIRLSLAQQYLHGESGFAVMDDPLTEMDPQRRALACEEIGKFAATHQLVIMTCHPQHRDELLSLAGAREVEVG